MGYWWIFWVWLIVIDNCWCLFNNPWLISPKRGERHDSVLLKLISGFTCAGCGGIPYKEEVKSEKVFWIRQNTAQPFVHKAIRVLIWCIYRVMGSFTESEETYFEHARKKGAKQSLLLLVTQEDAEGYILIGRPNVTHSLNLSTLFKPEQLLTSITYYCLLPIERHGGGDHLHFSVVTYP